MVAWRLRLWLMRCKEAPFGLARPNLPACFQLKSATMCLTGVSVQQEGFFSQLPTNSQPGERDWTWSGPTIQKGY